MKIAVGNDHPAYELKCAVKKRLEERGHEAIDVGSHNAESTDYPIYGAAVGELVASGEADLGVVMCGTGIGISIAANKTPGGARRSLLEHCRRQSLPRTQRRECAGDRRPLDRRAARP